MKSLTGPAISNDQPLRGYVSLVKEDAVSFTRIITEKYEKESDTTAPSTSLP